jgi:hypothetical protein
VYLNTTIASQHVRNFEYSSRQQGRKEDNWDRKGKGSRQDYRDRIRKKETLLKINCDFSVAALV